VCSGAHLTSELEQVPPKAKRHSLLTPELTGPWQVSDQSDSEGDEAVRLDIRYVQNRSTTVDFLILWKTAFVNVRRAIAR
jgi:lipopolysaccharide/colanic/teichoic acid biosynthesis glycosyltransferase